MKLTKIKKIRKLKGTKKPKKLRNLEENRGKEKILHIRDKQGAVEKEQNKKLKETKEKWKENERLKRIN